MPTQRLSMRRIRQLLALHFGAGASSRAIGVELGIAPSTVREYLARAAAAGVGWPLAADDTDESLMARLFANAGVRAGARQHAEPDWSALVRELKRPGVNLLVLWEEYRAIHPEGYAYSRYVAAKIMLRSGWPWQAVGWVGSKRGKTPGEQVQQNKGPC